MGTPYLWIAFNTFVFLAIGLDLLVFHRRAHRIGVPEATVWSVIWIGLSVAFGIGIAIFAGHQAALEFFTGYLIEKALSVDNLFLFLIIFRTFSVDEKIQHRVLEWGIIGALIMRGMMIAAGAALLVRFHWAMYFFGAFLVYAGIHLLFIDKEKIDPQQNAVFKFASRKLPVTRDYRGQNFFVRENGRVLATPLLLILLVVEITDVTLALDSIPAIFGVTHDAFLVYTSNVFALLGLRALFFLLGNILDRLQYLDEGLSAVLIFIGAKMIAEPWIKVPIGISLAVVVGVLLIAVLISWWKPPKREPGPRD